MNLVALITLLAIGAIVLFLLDLLGSGWGLFLLIALVILIYLGSVNAVRSSQKQRELMARFDGWFARKKAYREEAKPDSDWSRLLEDGEAILAEMADIPVMSQPQRRRWVALIKGLHAEIKQLELARIVAVSGSARSGASNIADLARLRREGLISAEEFEAFTEVFKKSSGAAASEVISAIEKLHAQYRAGAMGDGNYHSSLWSLMDRMERDLRS